MNLTELSFPRRSLRVCVYALDHPVPSMVLDGMKIDRLRL
jgi:hypothetical protein